jgi:amino acid adenylation domain-containing protein/non-ribosomal peptide synthase protein (TIGR01720 family)
LPFEKLVEELQPERSLSHSPLFQVMFVLQNAPMGELELSDLQLSAVESSGSTAKFDLTLSLWESERGLGGWWEYNSDLFEPESIKRLNAHFQVLLEEIVKQSEQPVQQLELLTPVERQQVLYGFNSSRVEYPREKCLHELFEEAVERRPDGIAVVHDQEQLSYGHLNERANQLGHYLQSQGVSSETIVGLCVERSVEMVVGILGILKAGGAYLPLDPNYPKERLEFMMDDAGVSMVLTDYSTKTKMTSRTVQLLQLEELKASLMSLSKNSPVCEAKPTNLAYVIYTSGSTGTPKGVMIEQHSIVRLVKSNPYIDFDDEHVFLQMAPITFDAATFEFWGALLNGARLAIGPSTSSSLAEMANQLQQQQVSTLWLTSGLFQIMTEHHLESFKSVTQLLAGGDVLPIAEVQKVLYKWPHLKLVNGYGPTEGTTFSCTYPVPKDWQGGVSVPIGRPIANTQIYVLDRQQQPVPIGVVGELYIGGAGVARGYLNQPELTTEKFIANPFSNELGTCLYRTGDLGRWHVDGNLEFLGRIDSQVKLRGFRIELGEIEAAVCSCPGVEQAIVSVWCDSKDYPHLVGHVVGENSHPLPGREELREYLKTRLPEYMIPGYFMELDKFPLTLNGKVDRKALPVPEISRTSTLTAPRTSVERRLAEIWCSVLGLSQVSIDDNFFALGGDSILSLQIIAQALQQGIHLTPRQLFEHQTIAEQAAIARKNYISVGDRQPLTGSFPLNPIQHFFFQFCNRDLHHFNQAYLLEVSPDLSLSTLNQILTALLTQHDGLRVHFEQQTNSEWKAHFRPIPEKLPCHVVELSSVNELQQQITLDQLLQQLQSSLEIESGPLLRFVLIKLGEDQPAKLLLLVHHLLIDVFSWRVLFEDFAIIYTQLKKGQIPSLPAKSSSVQQWALELQHYAQSPQMRNQLAYWLDQPYHLWKGLPLDAPLFPEKSYVAYTRQLGLTLDRQQTKVLLQQIPAEKDIQINEVLLTALLLAYHRWSGQGTLLLAREGHGRGGFLDQVDLSRTVGWFTSLHPLMLHIPGSEDKDLNMVMNVVKEAVRNIPNSGISYGILRYLGDKEIQQQIAELPQPQLNFNYLGQTDALLERTKSAFSIAEESPGHLQGMFRNPPHLLDITSIVYGDELGMVWSYNTCVQREESIKAFINYYQQSIEQLIETCLVV